MSIDTLYNLILADIVLIACYASYCIGRKEGRREEALRRRQQTVPPASNGPDEQVECRYCLEDDPDEQEECRHCLGGNSDDL